MLGFAFATFCSALLAIALRGPFVRLFLLTAACFGLHLIVAAYIGSRELRLVEAARPDRVAAIGRRAVRTTGLDAERAPVASDDPVDLLSGHGIEGGLFDEGFFEPIAELGPRTLDGPPTAPDRSIFDPVPSVDEPSGEPVEKPEQPAEEIAAAEAAPPADAGIDGEAAEPTFTAPPARRSRPPRRDKGRPIYVEPPAAEGDASIRAVND